MKKSNLVLTLNCDDELEVGAFTLRIKKIMQNKVKVYVHAPMNLRIKRHVYEARVKVQDESDVKAYHAAAAAMDSEDPTGEY